MRRALVVDDDDSIREVAEVALGLVGGWEVTTASSGSDGVERARELVPDVVLLDVMMPGMDGPTTLSHLRADPHTKDVPVILLTAKVRPGERRELDGLDVSGIIGKPFDPMTLATEVSEMLGWA
jgi:CheY-like chemotaxis protein